MRYGEVLLEFDGLFLRLPLERGDSDNNWSVLCIRFMSSLSSVYWEVVTRWVLFGERRMEGRRKSCVGKTPTLLFFYIF